MRFSSALLISLLSIWCVAQTENELVNEYIERYIENTSDEVDLQQFASDLLYYFDKPLNLNKAEASELFEVPFLSGFQALEIIEHRQAFGDFISIYELQVLPSFDAATISMLRSFITIRSNPLNLKSPKQIWQQGKHTWMTLAEIRTPRNKGTKLSDTATQGNYYTGSPIYNNLRYRFDYKRNISFGVNMEKDAGEPFLSGENSSGYDYYSYYLAIRDIGRLKHLSLGDFQANFGQGLTLSTGLAFGKSSIITNSKRNFRGFGAYRSLRENAYLRGAAVAVDLGKLETGVWVSYKKVDGNLDEEKAAEGADGELFTTTIQEDGGLHRTLGELEDKDAIRDFQTGFYAEYKGKRGKIGTVNYLRQMSANLQPNTRLYNQFNFTGDQYMKNGIYYDIVFKNFNFYGEVSHSSHQNSISQIHGALWSLGRYVDLSLVHRNYDKAFITLQTNGFGESSNASNEQGTYLGFQSKLSRKFTLLGYYDLYKTPWLSFRADAPASGNDLWTELQYKPSRTWNAYYRYRVESKQINGESLNTKQLITQTLSRHRLHINYTIRKGIELRSRMEWSIYEKADERSLGSLLYQDIIYKPFGKNLQLSTRVAYSVIEDFDNRIYSFEQTPLYDYPLFTHSFTGLRYYLMARYTVRRNLSMWLRYGLSQYEEPVNSLRSEQTVGTGLEETVGNKRQTITLQIRYIIR